MQADFFRYCDEIYSLFRGGKLRLTPKLATCFKLDYCPEPFLIFPAGENANGARSDGSNLRLHFLTTNPGLPLPRQRKGSPLVEGDNYASVADKLASNYLATFQKSKQLRAAFNRIKKMCDIASRAGYKEVLQLDAIPWHSATLPSKKRLPVLIKDCEITLKYVDALRVYLADKSVISIDSIGSQQSITPKSFQTDWLIFKASLIGLDHRKAKQLCKIVIKDGKVTGAALVQSVGPNRKIMYCVQGTNNLPTEDGRKQLASLL